jgi:pyrroloquinoline-quinone synthase
MSGRKRELGGLNGLGTGLPFIEHGGGRRERKKRVPMTPIELRNELLSIQAQKVHWAWPAFAGLVPKENTNFHFETEGHVFVEPFTRYLAGAMAQCPIPEVRAALAENIFEEETGAGARKIIIDQKLTDAVPDDCSHYALFLLMPEGMGHDTSEYGKRPPALKTGKAEKTEAFRNFLFDATQNQGWEVAVAVSTLFLEGNQHEWEVFAGQENLPEEFKGRSPHIQADTMDHHALHTGYGVPEDKLLLPRVHHVFDSATGDHRKAAWNMILNHIPPDKYKVVLAAMRKALEHWHAWRDEVAKECGIGRDREGHPYLLNQSA